MNESKPIYCLNNMHSVIVSSFLAEIEEIVEECTMYNEDIDGFRDIIENLIIYHNALGVSAMDGDTAYEDWYLSLPNNVYWALTGYFASLTVNKGEDIELFREKMLSLINKTIQSLNSSLIMQPWTESENKIHLN
jgi:hypothetical protein